MIHEPEFVRGNQNNYIRIACSEEIFNGYEYQMYKHNELKSTPHFQQRNQNGENYLYYEVGGMQSLDVFLQSQKLKRDFAVVLMKSIERLCKEVSEFALDISCIVFLPKYIMVSSDGKDVKFLYSFCTDEAGQEALEALFECCIEYLDYKDDVLMQQLYKIYEDLLEQKDRFVLSNEAEQFLAVICEKEQQEVCAEAIDEVQEIEVFQVVNEGNSGNILEKSKIAEKEFKKLKYGVFLLFAIDIAALFLWKPLTLLKIFFCVAMGGALLVLNIRISNTQKKEKEAKKVQQKEEEYKEEYETFCKKFGMENDGGTQIITMRDSEKFLYGMQNAEPQMIYFSEIKKIIGKDPKRAQICISQEGVSRVHVLVWREGAECRVEDLNSTNGTWVNGEALTPRNPKTLTEGDRVRFAKAEYIFR